jgi:acyl-CoA thioesterase-1
LRQLAAGALLLGALSLAGLAACERGAPPQPSGEARQTIRAGDGSAPAGGVPAAPAPAPDPSGPASAGTPVILFLGDSLTAGHGLPAELSFPSLIQERLIEQGYPYRVVNAGVSGDTSAGGLARLDWVMRQRIDVLVLALGANDGLRGLDIGAMRDNLAAIVERAKGARIAVVLAGMRMFPNYGPDYTRRFAEVFPELAGRYRLPFVPFLLEGVATVPTLNQGDGIHPNAEGARKVADNLWPVLKTVLKK